MSIIKAHSYDVFIDEDYSILNDYITSLNPSKLVIIVDENTEKHCLAKVKTNLHRDFLSVRIPSGEQNKTISTCQGLWQSLTQHHCDRYTLVINLGGGVICDLGGFVAGTYMRGIKFIQVPTTLLSQVDASIGGKTGVDIQKYKNLVGLFLEPKMIWVDTSFIKTLTGRELKSGYAEVIKHALTRSKSLWQRIITKPIKHTDDEWSSIISDNIAIKNFVVKHDFRDEGLRKVLNFGHTIGHGIESYFLGSNSALTHGESVAAGMICEAHISYTRNLISGKELSHISSFIIDLFPKQTKLSHIASDLINIMMHDKKNRSSKITFSLIKGIGDSVFDINVQQKYIIEALAYYDSL